MVTRRALRTLACAVWLGSTACHPAPTAPARGAAPPTTAAVLVHDDTGERLHIADLTSARLTPIGPEAASAHQPVWSPNGARLAYRVDDQLFTHDDDAPSDALVAGGLDLEAVRSYVFSPDGGQIAIVLHGALAVASIPPRAPAVPLAAYPGRRLADLAWAPDGSALIALIRDTQPSDTAQLAWIPLRGAPAQAVDARGAQRLLGWRSGQLLIVSVVDGRERVSSVPGPGRSPAPLALAPHDGEDLAVVDYAQAADLVVLARGGDADDDSALRVASPGGATVPWLAAHPRLGELAPTADGAWALFVDRATGGHRPGGSVYLVRVGDDQPRLVLAASPARSFSAPVPRPREPSR